MLNCFSHKKPLIQIAHTDVHLKAANVVFFSFFHSPHTLDTECSSVIPHKSCQSVKWLSNCPTSISLDWERDPPAAEFRICYDLESTISKHHTHLHLIIPRPQLHKWSKVFMYIYFISFSGCIKMCLNSEHWIIKYNWLICACELHLNRNNHGSIRSYWAPVILLLFVLCVFFLAVHKRKQTHIQHMLIHACTCCPGNIH